MAKILVIDDDIAINELIKINLELQGHTVKQAYNGIEGFALAKQEEPSLIVLDVMMPEVDGYTVAQRIRQHQTTTDIPIIMLTALSQLDNKVNGFNIGVDDYLTKPFEIDELIVRVRALLKRTSQIPKTSAVRDLLTYKEITLLPETHSIQINNKIQKSIKPTVTERKVKNIFAKPRRCVTALPQPKNSRLGKKKQEKPFLNV